MFSFLLLFAWGRHRRARATTALPALFVFCALAERSWVGGQPHALIYLAQPMPGVHDTYCSCLCDTTKASSTHQKKTPMNENMQNDRTQMQT
jgi:hypothetical protein